MTQTMPKHGEFCWNELMTGDPAKAKDFYGKLLGWQSTDIDMGHATYTMFKTADKDIGGMMQTPEGQNIPPHWMTYINVDDLEATVKEAETLGGKIQVPITPVADYGKFAVIVDPTGASIAFWKSLKTCENT